MTHGRTLVGAFCLLASTCVLAAEKEPKASTQGPYVDASTFSFEVPLEVLANKLFVEVEVGGMPRRFLFDTGSPSMMSRDLAAQLGLEVIEKIQGRDSHGAVVASELVKTDFVIGGTRFRDVPVFAADFPRTAQCLFDGVLGSELLPLCAWQIDLPDSTLRCSTDVAKLDHVAGAAKQPLHDFGYPHAPILDVEFARNAKSKAMFDTGSPEYLAISPPDLGGASRNGGVGRIVLGAGSLGGSIGGLATVREQRIVELKALSIGSVSLGRTGAVLRESAPSLIGASLLEHFVITLDAQGSAAYFDRYRGGPFVGPSYGLGLSFEDVPSVSLVWEGSPAAAAGLRVCQHVTSINGKPAETSCDGIRSALRAMADRDTLNLEWDGGAAVLKRAQALPD